CGKACGRWSRFPRRTARVTRTCRPRWAWPGSIASRSGTSGPAPTPACSPTASRACRGACRRPGPATASTSTTTTPPTSRTGTGPLADLAVFVATVIEGEMVFVAAAVLVHAGHLEAAGVYTAAALGGSVGDQIYYYALRGRLHALIDRFPTFADRRDRAVRRV